ncbi:MAG: hemolysin III family protein [Gammaproteobacteria bacterium]|nr:hemolysin III family protein [Gammaproteobacteria bacterium]
MDTFSIPGFTDPFNSISHLVGALVFLIYGFKLILFARGNRDWVIAVSLFVFSGVFLLSMSGIFHLLEHDSVGRVVLQRLDHAGIFALIAGTFTPVHTILFKGFWRWGILFFIWVLAIAGITLKSIFFNELAEWVGLMFYLGLGWIGILSAYLTHRLHGFTIIKPLLYGALAYTIGASLEFLRLPVVIPGVIGPHELFHIAVLFGIAWHWQFIMNLIKLKRKEQTNSF